METMSTAAYNAACPGRQVLDIISDRWAVLIVCLLEAGPLRFSALQRQITGVSQKMLTQNLRALERNGLVQRTLYAEVPLRVEYALTPMGQALCGPLAVLWRWSEDNITAITEAQQVYDRRS